ncbi:MAG: 4-(cytidine 5'-diphospho)-2-C-methyl-D-erythritol kinase, partial [Clostridia bacterium]|nr:4-(cytidine 5'-diphospho)-2-C-methyl-D-erythritol kinase [Clostridia bacterium]
MKTIQKRKVIIKVPAKINLTLDVLGKDEKFHFLKSLVSSINVYDIISLEKREDDHITLSVIGDCGCKIEDNTAYKAAKLFKEKFSVGGVDITINKNIPLGAGLGGSSADIAGVLNGMKLLFRKRGDLLPLANELGSDSGFMLGGGIAVIQGRGDIICRQKLKLSANILLVTEESSISAKESYNAYDKIGKTYDST